MDCLSYQKALNDLYVEEPDNVVVSHNPMTDRYNRAYQYLEVLIGDGEAIGFKAISGDCIELVVFCESRDGEPGEYAVFRIQIADVTEGVFAEYAELFAFYDNQPDSADTGNQAFYTTDEARTFMQSYGYKSC